MSTTPFKLRSGNSPLFKAMGSSPVKDTDPHTGLNPPHTEDNHVEDVLPIPPEKETIEEKKTIRAEGEKDVEGVLINTPAGVKGPKIPRIE